MVVKLPNLARVLKDVRGWLMCKVCPVHMRWCTGVSLSLYRWDLRYTSNRPVLKYETPDPDSLLWSLALEPCHGTVLSGQGRDILC
jgi:hypothetical protein